MDDTTELIIDSPIGEVFPVTEAILAIGSVRTHDSHNKPIQQ